MLSTSSTIRWCLPLICTIIAAGCGVNQAPGQAAATPVVLPSAVPVATLGKPTLVPAPIKPTIELMASAVPATPEPVVIQPCIFPLPQSAAAAVEPVVPALEAYVFGEPRVIQKGDLILVGEWLPDNRRLLFTRSLSTKPELSIDIVDTQTGILTNYGKLPVSPIRRPFWLEAEQSVAVTIPRNDQRGFAVGASLNFQHADGTSTVIEPNLYSGFVMPTADRRSITLLTNQQADKPAMIAINSAHQKTLLPSIANAVPNIGNNGQALSYQSDPWYTPRFAWRPDGNRLVSYTQDSTLLIDPSTQTICMLELGSESGKTRWAIDAQWSPDGRYIAFNTTIYRVRGDISSVEVTILDTSNGQVRNLPLSFYTNRGFIWLPGSQQLAILGQTGLSQDRVIQIQVYLFDLRTNQERLVLPQYFFDTLGYWDESPAMSMSQDGRFLALQCRSIPNNEFTDLCISNVSIQP